MRGYLFGGFVLLCFMLVGCSSDTINSARSSGWLNVRLAADTTSLNKGSVSTMTKSVSDEFVAFLDTEDYRVLILQGKDTVKAYERYDQIPAEIELPQGTYDLIASKGEDIPAAFGNPYFEGSSSFTVKEDMLTPIDITCMLGNTRITAEYSEDFGKVYEDCEVLLSTKYTTEDLKISKSETQAAYVKVAKDGSEMIVGIALKKIGEESVKTYYVPTTLKLERKQNVRLIFKPDAKSISGVGLGIVLDDELTEVEFSTEIPDFMWLPFEKPILSAVNFENGASFRIHSGLFKEEPTVDISMPAGIGSLIIKYWKEGENEENALVYDLTTDGGVNAAKDKHFVWSTGDNSNVNLHKKKAAKLYLQDGINSLESPDEGEYTYHYKIYGSDANGKPNLSNVLAYDVVVLASSVPVIESKQGEDISDIVEGDELKSDWDLDFVATGLIDKTATKVVVNEKEYDLFSDQGAALNAAFGAVVKVENEARLSVKFPKNFAASLSAPISGSQKYQFIFHLKDLKGKTISLNRTITVNAPDFSVETTDGDAFAKRIILRASMPIGHKEKLSFQYKNEGGSNWFDIDGHIDSDGGVNYVDTLKGLSEKSRYNIRAIYRGLKIRVSEEVQVETERSGGLPNAEFDSWYSEKTDKHGNAITKNTGFVYWNKWFPWDKDDPTTKGWNTVNQKTTQDGSTPSLIFGWKPTPPYVGCCYVANSGTIKTADDLNGGAALIQTVGWGSGNTAAGGSSAIKKVTAGELFLGDVDNSTLEPVYGYTFTSRPTGFSFDYKYKSKEGSGDHFIAEIVLLSFDGQVIARQSIADEEAGNCDSWSTKTVHIKYSGEQSKLKASKMYIRFKSSYSDDKDYLEKNLMVKPAFGNLSDGESIGSQLYIDNVKLIYE